VFNPDTSAWIVAEPSLARVIGGGYVCGVFAEIVSSWGSHHTKRCSSLSRWPKDTNFYSLLSDVLRNDIRKMKMDIPSQKLYGCGVELACNYVL
jgi:hypothetical protein